jgi:RNA-directed DNA polymerase
MHPTKTKIVYCKDGKRGGKYPNVQFDFLGYCFRPRLVRRFRANSLFCGFNPAVSKSAMKAMRQAIRELNFRHQTHLSMDEIARRLNPLLRGWIEYYGRYAPSALYPPLRYVNQALLAWVMRTFKRFKGHNSPGLLSWGYCTKRIESRSDAVALGYAYLFPLLSFGGA